MENHHGSQVRTKPSYTWKLFSEDLFKTLFPSSSEFSGFFASYPHDPFPLASSIQPILQWDAMGHPRFQLGHCLPGGTYQLGVGL